MSQPLVFRGDVVVSVLEHETILLDLDSKFFYSMNPAGWAVAEVFETGATREQVEALCRRQLGTDEMPRVAAFLDELIDERLIEPSGASAGEAPTELSGSVAGLKLEKHREPLQKVMISAFDPTLPLAE